MFQPDFSNGCHDVLMMSIKLSDVVIPNIHGADYCCIGRISKNQAIKFMQNIDLTKKAEHYKTWKFFITYKNE